MPQTGQTGWGARVVASERARKEGRGCLGRVKCYRSERVRRSGDLSVAPRERLAGRAIDTRSQILISGLEKKPSSGAGVGDSLSVCGDDEGREGRRNVPCYLRPDSLLMAGVVCVRRASKQGSFYGAKQLP